MGSIMEDEGTNSTLSLVNTSIIRPNRLNSTSECEWQSAFEAASQVAFGLIGTTMCICVFLMHHYKKSLHTTANIYVLSLITSNFLRCVLCVPIQIIIYKSWISGESFCKIANSSVLFTNLVSVLSVLLIAFDRNCAVSDPLKYIKKSSKKKAVALIVFVWILSFTCVIPIFLGVLKFDIDTCDVALSTSSSLMRAALIYEGLVASFALIVPLTSVFFLYYAMYKAATNSASGEGRSSYSSCISSDVVVNIKSSRCSGESEYSLRRHCCTNGGQNTQRKNRFLKKHRAAVTGIIVVLSFLFCWSPYFIFRLYQQFRIVRLEIRIFVHLSIFMSSLLDPYIYFYRNKSTWNHTKKLIEQLFYRKKHSIPFHSTVRCRVANITTLAASFDQTMIKQNPPQEKNLPQALELKKYEQAQILVYAEIAPQNKNSTIKKYEHQDSLSSNCSSDASATAISTESETLSCDFQKKPLEESVEEEHAV